MRKHDAIKVHENHKRTISNTLYLLDEMLCEFDRIANGQEDRAVLYVEKNTLSVAQRSRLRAIVSEMRKVISEIKDVLSLKPEETDLAGKVWASASSFWEVLVETKSKYLRRYGEVPQSLAEFIDPPIEDLIKHLIKIVETVHKENSASS